METYTLSHFPAAYSTVHIALFTHVSNSPQIRKRLIEASTMLGEEGDKARAAVDYGFLEGRMLVSRHHLLTAIQTTLLNAFPSFPFDASSSATTLPPDSSSDPASSSSAPSSTNAESVPAPKCRSHNLHSELLLTLSPNNNISDSIRRHGISDATDVLVVVRIGTPEQSQADVWKGISGVVDGELRSLGELDEGSLVDWSRIDKVYKLSDIAKLPLSKEEMLQAKISAVINSVAIKSVT